MTDTKIDMLDLKVILTLKDKLTKSFKNIDEYKYKSIALDNLIYSLLYFIRNLIKHNIIPYSFINKVYNTNIKNLNAFDFVVDDIKVLTYCTDNYIDRHNESIFIYSSFIFFKNKKLPLSLSALENSNKKELKIILDDFIKEIIKNESNN